MTTSPDTTQGRTLFDWVTDRLLRGAIGFMRLLPYEKRVPAMGWFNRRILAPLAGYQRRAAMNLKYIFPDMDRSECASIVAEVSDNAGRTFIENYSPDEFLARNADAKITGPGLAALEKAQTDGRPVILVTGHFGNYEAPARRLSVAVIMSAGFTARPATSFSTITTPGPSPPMAARSSHKVIAELPASCATSKRAASWCCFSTSM